MSQPLDRVAPAFVAMAHRIVWCTVATVGPDGAPNTRILHPISWDDTPGGKAAGWQRFVDGPAPVGYDPSIIPQWEDPSSPEFGILRLTPHRLRLMPGSLMLAGQGELLTWRA